MRVPTIKLWKGDDFVIVEPGTPTEKLWRENGYKAKAGRKPSAEKRPAKRTV